MDTLPAHGDRLRATTVASGAMLEYLRATSAAYADLLSRLTVAARWLDEAGSFTAAAAAHRRLTRQFLDGQRTLLHRRALAVDEAGEIEAEATAGAEATLCEAYRIAGVERATSACADPRAATSGSAWRDVAVDGPGASPTNGDDADVDDSTRRELQQLLDEWWRSELAASNELLSRAMESADLIRSLARIEAGEILADADMPSPLLPPSPAFHGRDLLPPEVRDTITSAAEGSKLLDLCDSLLLVLGDESPRLEEGCEPPSATMAWPQPAGPAAALPPPVVEVGIVLPVSVPAFEGVGEDAFGRFWGDGPEPLRFRRRMIVRQATVGMLAFTGVLTVALALIG